MYIEFKISPMNAVRSGAMAPSPSIWDHEPDFEKEVQYYEYLLIANK
jgi:hypothetical protein